MTEHHFSGPAEDLLTWLAASDDNTSIADFQQQAQTSFEAQQDEWSRVWESLPESDPYRGTDPYFLRPPYDGTDWAAVHTELETAGMITTVAGGLGITITDAGRAWVRGRRDDVEKARAQRGSGEHTTARPTATVQDLDGQPLNRDAYAAQLRDRADTDRLGPRLELLREGEATTIAALLDELAGVYPDEELGRLAREMAVRIYDRLGT